jgi:hypothetical protein
MKIKLWQTIVIVTGLLLGSGLIIYTLFMSNNEPDVSYSMTLLDAETGDVYSVADYRGSGIILPAVRPGTNDQYALIEISKDSAGVWRISPGARRMYGALNVPIKAFDQSSGDLTAQPGSIKKYAR